jgi:hypothetical protein
MVSQEIKAEISFKLTGWHIVNIQGTSSDRTVREEL